MREVTGAENGVLDVGVLAVVPSPYQRDIFAAMQAREDMRLRVFYLEDQSPDSPWPLEPLRNYEEVLGGRWFAAGNIRWHQCKMVQQPAAFDFFIVNSFMSSTAQALMRGKLAGCRWAFWGERLREQSLGWRRFVQNVLVSPFRRATLLAGIGSLAVESYRRKFPGISTVNIPYHCELAAFQRRPARPGERDDGVLRILFCGQMIARKGLDTLLEAFAKVADRRESIELVLVGREAELPKMLEGLQKRVRERVDYRGFQAPADLPAEFERADLFVLPSRHDGWGVVVNQALGAGLPIVCSDAVGAAYDLIEPERNGVIVPAGDATALAQALDGLLQQPAKLAAMGRESSKLAPNWSPQAGAARWANAIQSALSMEDRIP